MAPAVHKITLSSSRDISFNKLVLSQSNVRRVKAGVSIEKLAEDIARRTLLQSLSVRPMLYADGVETGMFEVPAGGRRYRALQLLVKQKRLAKTAPVPCVVRASDVDISAEEDSLAENVHCASLHPLDQFRAFQALRQKGQSEEEIAAAFFVGVNMVQQRLRLAAVSEKLLDIYAEDGISLEQLIAFTMTNDHARQEQVWESLQRSYSQKSYRIRRMLTERTVRASDILLDNWLKGRRRAVWISKSDKLIEDAQCDWSAFGMERLLMTPLSRVRQGTPIRFGQGILFATYATLRTDKRGEKLSRVRQIVEWLGSGFDGVIIFDESHAMQSAAGLKGQRGEQALSQECFAEPWAAELGEVPEFTESTIHVAGGLLLPIWKRLPNEGARVYRLQTDTGGRIIGCKVSSACVATALANDAPTMTPENAFAALLEGRTVFDLAEGLQLRRVRVMGGERIELPGFNDTMRDRLKACSLFHEIVSWKLRMFVPTDATGIAVLARVLDRYAIERIAERESA